MLRANQMQNENCTSKHQKTYLFVEGSPAHLWHPPLSKELLVFEGELVGSVTLLPVVLAVETGVDEEFGAEFVLVVRAP